MSEEITPPLLSFPRSSVGMYEIPRRSHAEHGSEEIQRFLSAGHFSGSLRQAVAVLENILVQQEIQREPDPEAGDIGRDMRQTASMITSRKIDMDPGSVMLDESL